MQHTEKGFAAAGSGSNISKDSIMHEDAEAHGVYHVNCIGPVEHMREQYIALRDRLNAKGIKAFFDKLINGGKLAAQMALIPLEQKWADEAVNVVTTVGKNYALDGYLQTAVTIVGPYMGLINANASAAVIGDTMASHAGWLEVGNANAPTYTAPRKTCAWSAASAGSKALSSALSFAITSSGTVGGCFIVLSTSAVSTIDSTAGTLYSAGAFTGGSKTVANADTLNVSYTASL
jgi:hypothetical protein